MLPADLDDEQRAHLAHEHPNDLDSSPSSPSSGVPTFYESRHRPKPAPRHRSHTATDGSRSSHLLARLVSREEEVREISAALVVTTERLETESSRANAAERRALDYFHRLRIATENRERAEQESARLREELKLYKLQLENAQKEIFRAQDIIDQVAAQRNEAEADAAKARTKARKLQEEKLVMLAREEGRRMGYEEGLSMGRRIGYDEDDNADVLGLGATPADEERDDSRPHAHLHSSGSIRRQPTRSESAPPIHTFEAASPPPPPTLPIPSRVRTPSHELRMPSPPHGSDEPETIHPIPIRPSPVLPTQPISVPLDDGWIPRADSRTSYIAVPPPHGLQQPIPATPRPAVAEVRDGRATPQSKPTPVPPPARLRDHAYQSAPPHVPHGHASSLASRASSHISQYDLVNKRPGSSLRNEIYAGRARSGSQRSRESTSRNEHRDPERRHSNRTEAETIVEQWRADSDSESPPRNPLRSFTPAPLPHPHRQANIYRPREVVTPAPPGDVDDPRSRTPIPTESTATRPRPSSDDPNPASARSLYEHLRQRFRQRPGSGGSGSIPNIIVESPSEPETAISPSATAAAQPDLLSPEAANRPLPQDDAGQHDHAHSSHSQSQPQSHRHHHHHHHPPPSYDDPPRSGTPYPPWPAGFVPYPPGFGTTSTSTSTAKSGPERDHRRAYSRSTPSPAPYTRAQTHPHPHAHRYQVPSSDGGRSWDGHGHVPARTQSASMSMGRAGSAGGGTYEAAPLPPGVTYPAPPGRPQTSHRRQRDREEDRDRDRERERERARDARHWDWERVWDKDGDRRERARGYGRERTRGDRAREEDPEDMGLDGELTRSPAPLQRPISLFDSDEA